MSLLSTIEAEATDFTAIPRCVIVVVVVGVLSPNEGTFHCEMTPVTIFAARLGSERFVTLRGYMASSPALETNFVQGTPQWVVIRTTYIALDLLLSTVTCNMSWFPTEHANEFPLLLLNEVTGSHAIQILHVGSVLEDEIFVALNFAVLR